MVLFLDFDGCMHGMAEAHFCRLPALESLLREPACQHVRIVVSSTWRELYSLDRLRSFFSPDIQARVIGVTPLLNDDADAERCDEVKEYLKQHPEVRQWCVVDDCGEWPSSWNVVRPDPTTGLSAADVDELRALIVADEKSPRVFRLGVTEVRLDAL